MFSENFKELIRLIAGSDLSQDMVQKRLANNIELFFKLSPEERSMAMDFVLAISGTTNKSNPPNLQFQTKPMLTPQKNDLQDNKKIDIAVSDVHRNEQVNIVALCQKLQTILCSDLAPRTYYALVPQRGGSSFFTLSPEGENYQRLIRDGYGIHLERFPRKYAVLLYARGLLTNNTIDFWADMKKEDLFRYWDPEKGPYSWYKGKSLKEVQMLRVYEVDCDLIPFILETDGYRHALEWRGGIVDCHGTPLLDDSRMKQQFEKFNEILRKHGNPPANILN